MFFYIIYMQEFTMVTYSMNQESEIAQSGVKINISSVHDLESISMI